MTFLIVKTITEYASRYKVHIKYIMIYLGYLN